MEPLERNVGSVHDLDEDAPLCVECGNAATQMYRATYEMWVACKSEPVCVGCADEIFKNRLRTAAGNRGLRLGV